MPGVLHLAARSGWLKRLLRFAVAVAIASSTGHRIAYGQDVPEADKPAAAAAAAKGFWDQDTLTGNWGGVRTGLIEAGVTLGLLEQDEVWGNAAGGLRRGFTVNGLTTPSVSLDLDRLFAWTGATIFVDGYQIHGRGPTSNLVGNLQVVSNIEATDSTKLYMLWLEQKLFDGRLTIRLGQEGANDQMMITKYGALFLNSSFGYPGLPAADLPQGGPNYPIATPFVRVQFQATDRLTLVGAVFNGEPAASGTGDPQLRDRTGTAFRLNDHGLSFGEIWYSINQGDKASGLAGTYKIGAWYDSAHFAYQSVSASGLPLADPAASGVPRGHSTGYAVYAIVDQLIWQKPDAKGQGVGVFLQVMGAPEAFNLSDVFIEGGFNWIAPFAGRDNDIAGLGASYLGISPAARKFGNDIVYCIGLGAPYTGNETVVEATYQYQVAPWWTLQPDLQIVVNPGAGIPSTYATKPLKNAVVGGLRALITF